MNSLRLLILFIFTTFIAACGFQLKGQGKQAQRIQAIYLQCECDDDNYAAIIVEQLQNNDIHLISTPGNGMVVTLSNMSERTFNTAIGDNDRSKEVALTSGFLARIEREGQLLGEQRIESNVYLQYNSDTYLGDSAEAEQTRTRLMRDSADKLIRYLNSIAYP